MPNHCYNRVNVYSDEPKVIKEIHDIFEVGTNPYRPETVFGQIIPEPDWRMYHLQRMTCKSTVGINPEVRKVNYQSSKIQDLAKV